MGAMITGLTGGTDSHLPDDVSRRRLALPRLVAPPSHWELYPNQPRSATPACWQSAATIFVTAMSSGASIMAICLPAARRIRASRAYQRTSQWCSRNHSLIDRRTHDRFNRYR
jgi:hypothetical protein